MVNCRVCGAPDAALLCTTHNEHSQTKALHNFRCVTCGSVFIGDSIQNEELGVAYASLDTDRYYAETEKASAGKMKRAAKDIAGLVSRDANVLDVGGGDGTFLLELNRQSFANLFLHEIPGDDIPKIAGVTRAIYRDFDYSSVPEGKFDIVTMMDVLEHVPNPAETVRAAWRALKPGGILYAHTPAVSRLDRLMHRLLKVRGVSRVGRTWQRGRTSIFHLQNYTPRSLTLLLSRQGFGVERLETRNELSWPVSRYVRIYLLEKQGLPGWLSPVLTPLVWPLIATGMNANKAILVARRGT